jgi:hypothetical protein
VDHRRARDPGQLTDGHQGGHSRGRDGLAALVDHEAAVGVAVERQADVGALGAHPLLRLNVEAGDRATMEQVRDDVLAVVRRGNTVTDPKGA